MATTKPTARKTVKHAAKTAGTGAANARAKKPASKAPPTRSRRKLKIAAAVVGATAAAVVAGAALLKGRKR